METRTIFGHVLVPLDCSQLAECVLPHIALLARVFGSRVTLLHAVESCPGADEPFEWHLHKVAAQAYLNELKGYLRHRDVSAETVLLDGPAPERIVGYARGHNVDLVALSSHGQSGLSDWAVSSVAQKVIARAPCSVLMVPAYHSLDPKAEICYRRILLPLDGSTRAECVLPVASTLARACSARLILAHAVAQPEVSRLLALDDDICRLRDELVQRNQAAIEAYFATLLEWLPAETKARVAVGKHVAATLQDMAQEEDVDLILLSAHGYSGIPRWPYGGVARSFIAYGGMPVLVIQDMPGEEVLAMAAERIMHTLEAEDVRRPSGTGPKGL